MSAAPMLAAHGLGFGYGAVAVGRGVDLEVRPGEVLCLLGPNGSGKTTLFKTMLGLLAPQGGEVRLEGAPLANLTRPQIARRLAYVPQAHAAHFPFTVIDMVVMGRTAHLGLFASPGPEDRRKALAALAALGIAELAMREYTRISGGQRQLALIARAHVEADAAADRVRAVAEAQAVRGQHGGAAHDQPSRPRASSHRKNGAPIMAVNMPIGTSMRAMVRAMVSTNSR